MKVDISKSAFKTIAGFRGDSLACPQAFGGDMFSGCSFNCFFCFCREMEAELFQKYFTGYSRDLVRPCVPEDYRKLFDKAFGSDKPTNDWLIKCLRYGLPFNMGSKAETFCIEDRRDGVVVPVLELFREYKVPVIFETKAHYIGLNRYLDIIKDLNAAVIVSIMGGSDTLNYKLESNLPAASARWYLVEQLNRLGIWTAVRWEPILVGINSTDDIFDKYGKMAKKTGAKHVSFFNYRTSNRKMAEKEFEAHGYNYLKLLERNLDENWRPVGVRFVEAMHRHGVKCSSPDFVNFPFGNSCESCCGVDGKFKPYQFTFQHACKVIERKGSVSWEDMEEVSFREPEAYERLKENWNGKAPFFTLADSPDIKILDWEEFEGKRMAVYGKDETVQKRGKRGFGF